MKSSSTTRHSGPVHSAPLVDASAALFSWVFIEAGTDGRRWRFLELWRVEHTMGSEMRGGTVCEGPLETPGRASVGLSVPDRPRWIDVDWRDGASDDESVQRSAFFCGAFSNGF